MRQRRTNGTREERKRNRSIVKYNAKPFIGTCSNCGAKLVKVTKYKNAQICISDCLARAISNLEGPSPVSADQVIKAE
jgi:hypothetical protein